MATINLSGQLVNTNGNLRNILTLTTALTTTGSNSIANTSNINTGSWQIIDQGSNGDFRFGMFTNLDATSSIKVAINSAGTSSCATWLQPNDVSLIQFSGSATLYAQAYGTNSPVLLQYFLSEK